MRLNIKIQKCVNAENYMINKKNIVMNDNFYNSIKKLPDKSIDMIFCDPPYGKTVADWDIELDLAAMWVEFNRVIKTNGAMVITGQQPFSSKLVWSNIKHYKHNWYWVKNTAGAWMQGKNVPLQQVEDIFVFGKTIRNKVNYYPIMEKRENPITYVAACGSTLLFKKGRTTEKISKTSYWKFPKNVLYFKSVPNNSKIKVTGITQKPVELVEYLIKTYTKEDAVILDPTAGSGTTGIAALNLNRRFCLIEKNQENFTKMMDRFRRGEG